MKIVIVSMFSIFMTACTSTQHFKGPNGENMVSTDCHGWARDISTCYTEIAKQCPNGYIIVDAQQQAGQVNFVNPDTGMVTPINTVSRSVIAACK